MQAKDTIRLARRIRKKREKKTKGKLTPWRVVCETLNIRTDQGKLDTGAAYKIAYQEYEPSGREMRLRFGLRDKCSKCGRTFRAPKPPQVARALSPARLWWNRMKGEEREKLIELSYSNYLKWRKSHERVA